MNKQVFSKCGPQATDHTTTWGAYLKFLPPTLLVGMQIDAATVENTMEVSQKTKNRTTV